MKNKKDNFRDEKGRIVKGSKLPKWYKNKISLGNMGRINSLETRRKLSKIQKGIPKWSEKERKRIAKKTKEDWKNGIFGEERNKKISEAMKLQHELGLRKRVVENLVKSLKGRKMSEKTKEALRNSHIGDKGYWLGKQRPEISGENNWAWQGGKSFEPYTKEFNESFKLTIKQRDGFMCLKCGMREEDHQKLFNQKEHIHHIDYDKKLTILENCCVLCLRCNVEVNKNRPHWKKFFQSLLSEIYGYQYSEDGKIILNLGEVI